jgi:hypothetical protein
MNLKVQVTTVDGAVMPVTVNVATLDAVVAVKKAVLALDMDMSNVSEAYIVTN